jgi:predicted permease
MHVAGTIIPIFSIIILGWFIRNKGFVPPEFTVPANRLVFYFAIPALIFRAVSKASFKTQFNISVLAITLFSILAVFAVSWLAGKASKINGNNLGTFIQSSIHGNTTYIGLAVVYYYMGQEGFVKAGIISGFVLILQNLLSVTALVVSNKEVVYKGDKLFFAKKVLGNPIILAAMAGIFFSVAEVPVPDIIGRSMDILGGLALPMALLIIGASLSFEVIRQTVLPASLAGLLKLVLLPGVGFVIYVIRGIAPAEYLPALIILAAPTATITYIMAKEMNGDADFAIAAISLSTLISALTLSFWLNVAV